MIVPDSSVLVAGFVAAHRFHAVALSALVKVKEDGNLIAHTLAESYSVLSAPGGIYRAEPRAVVEYLEQFLDSGPPLAASPGAYLEALSLLADNGRSGGAVYDALIALAAREAKATLVSLDRRAAPVYALCGVDAQLLVEAG